MLVTRLITHYILYTLRLGIPPWYYFQLNSAYFNTKKGIYSKIDIDQHIPQKWRLPQAYLDKSQPPSSYPVFLKPEWGQNSYGIQLVHNLLEFQDACVKLESQKVPYIVQSLAQEAIEYEVFYIQDPADKNNIATLTITQAINDKDQYPINAVKNKNTQYYNRTQDFSKAQLDKIQAHLQELPYFRIARVAIKANSKDLLIAGEFSIIEINLFAPMPLHLLDKKHDMAYKKAFVKTNMWHLAKLSGQLSRKDFKPFIFIKKVIRHYQIQ